MWYGQVIWPPNGSPTYTAHEQTGTDEKIKVQIFHSLSDWKLNLHSHWDGENFIIPVFFMWSIPACSEVGLPQQSEPADGPAYPLLPPFLLHWLEHLTSVMLSLVSMLRKQMPFFTPIFCWICMQKWLSRERANKLWKGEVWTLAKGGTLAPNN